MFQSADHIYALKEALLQALLWVAVGLNRLSAGRA